MYLKGKFVLLAPTSDDISNSIEYPDAAAILLNVTEASPFIMGSLTFIDESTEGNDVITSFPVTTVKPKSTQTGAWLQALLEAGKKCLALDMEVVDQAYGSSEDDA